jgi:RNA polymerase sigma-70 factor (ECF subfamily)
MTRQYQTSFSSKLSIHPIAGGRKAARVAARAPDLTTLDRNELMRLLDGPADGRAALVRALAPLVKTQVAFSLMRRRRQLDHQRLAQECEDLTQEAFAYLFQQEGHVFRVWDSGRGRDFTGFVRMVVDHVVQAKLRSRRKNPWTESPTENEAFDMLLHNDDNLAQNVAERDLALRIIDTLRQRLSPMGYRMFMRLMIRQESPAAVRAAEKMSAQAVNAWRCRLRKAIAATRDELMSTGKLAAAVCA